MSKPYTVRTSPATATTARAIKFNTGVKIGDIMDDSLEILVTILYRDPTPDELATIISEIAEKYGRSIK